jgi:hypothetical protein
MGKHDGLLLGVPSKVELLDDCILKDAENLGLTA